MSSLCDRLQKRGMLNSPPWFLENNIQLEVVMGSEAYGVTSGSSDVDVYGFVMPPKDYIFPHLRGEIVDFSTKGKVFQNWQQHHIDDKEHGKEYDISIFAIQRFFRLCMENNPNMVDALFVPRRCILHSTEVGEIVRENRKLFLHKGCWQKFKGYAYGQLNKMNTKKPIGKRKETIEKYGYDTKFAYHVVRLLNEVEQILVSGDLDLQKNNDQLKAIRSGEWDAARVTNYFEQKESQLETLYHESTLPWGPDEDAIHGVLMRCIEHHYGSIDQVPMGEGHLRKALMDIRKLTDGALV